MKRIGTREEVFKGIATRTAGGLKREDIIEKQFGTKILYISKKLSDKMRENFNIIRTNNPNHLRNKQQKRTMVANKNNNNNNNSNETIQTNQQNQINQPNQPNQPQQTHQTLNQVQKLQTFFYTVNLRQAFHNFLQYKHPSLNF